MLPRIKQDKTQLSYLYAKKLTHTQESVSLALVSPNSSSNLCQKNKLFPTISKYSVQ